VKLKRLIKEFEVGDKLFADIGNNAGPHARWKDLIKRLYAPDYEPNTEDEDNLLTLLSAYLEHPEAGVSSWGLNLKDLLPLKKKFPKILDPSVPSTARERAGGGSTDLAGYNDHVWRGATMKLSTLQKLLPKGEWFGSPAHDWSAGFINPGITYKSRGSYGFTSFSQSSAQASTFKGKYDEQRVSVIIGIKNTHPKLLFTPGFMNALSRYAEYETLFVGKAVKPDIIIINDPRVIQQLIKDIQAEEERIYKETGKAKLIGQEKFFKTWKLTAKLTPSWLKGDLRNPESKFYVP
jgi:hypothetical protein